MENEIAELCAEGLSLFGKTNRLISHELKNILAIMSETLGLMDELSKLSEPGMALKPEKLSSLSESILEEVERANKIIRNMNSFAHSVDEFVGKVDIGRALTLMIEFCKLDSASRKTKVHLVDNKQCVIHTSQFFLDNLIYNVLDFSLNGADPKKEIRISFDSDEDNVRIIFSGIDTRIIGEFPTKKENLLSAALCGEVSPNPAAGELKIVLPVQIDESFIKALIPDP